MAALFPKHKPTSQHAILHVLSQPNPQRKGAAEWTVAQLRPRLTELCGTPCPNKNVGMTLRSKLEPKGLVVSHKGKSQAQELLKFSDDPESADSVLRQLPEVKPAAPKADCKCESCGWKLGCVNPACDTKAGAGAATSDEEEDDDE